MSTGMRASNAMEDRDVYKSQIEKWRIMIQTGVLPASIKTPEIALLFVLKGEEMGMTPMRSLGAFVSINGVISLSAECMLALVRERATAQISIIERSATRACIKVRRGTVYVTNTAPEWEDWSEIEFTIEDAETAKLLAKSVWKQYPADMLWARCVSRMARSTFPDVIQGVYTPEEARSIQPAPGETYELIGDDDVDRLKTLMEQAGIDEKTLCQQARITHLYGLSADRLPIITDYLQQQIAAVIIPEEKEKEDG